MIACGGQRLYHHAMRVLANIIDCQRATGRFERFIRVTQGQLDLPEPDEGIERQSLQTLPFASHPGRRTNRGQPKVSLRNSFPFDRGDVNVWHVLTR